MSTLYQWHRKNNPKRFRVDDTRVKIHDLKKEVMVKGCKGCILDGDMKPEYCDSCENNPYKEVLRKAGLM